MRPQLLSERQRQLLALAATGLTLAQAASELGFSRSFAYNELQRVKSRLEMPTLVSCVVRALVLGEIIADPTGSFCAPAPGTDP